MCASSPRIYALDLIIPEAGEQYDPVVVLEVNGARSGCSIQRLLYGDDRVQVRVLELLSEFGNGVISSVSQGRLSLLQEKFSSEQIMKRLPLNCGIYSAHSAYVPIGNPQSRCAEAYVKSVASRLGIGYRDYTLFSDHITGGFQIQFEDKRPVVLRDWEPEGILWPYSLDQRTVPLPVTVPVCNPPKYAAFTTNKYLVSSLLPSSGPKRNFILAPSVLAGFWARSGGSSFPGILRLLRDKRFAVLKPLAARRSFGVVVAPVASLQYVAEECGLIGNSDDVVRAAEVFMVSLLWGEFVDLSAVLQPYIQPKLVRHPRTSDYHAGVIRATVLCQGSEIECIDAVRILCSAPLTRGVTRESLILDSSKPGDVVGLDDAEYAIAVRGAEDAVRALEEASDEKLQSSSLAGLLRSEADLLIEALDDSSDVPATELWQRYRNSICLPEALAEEVNT